MQNFNMNKWEEEQRRNEAFRMAMANGGVQDPAMYDKTQLSKSGQVPYSVGAPGPLQVNNGPWGDAKYAPMTQTAPRRPTEIESATPPVEEAPPPAPSNPAPLIPAGPEAAPASPPPMDRPTAEKEQKKEGRMATQANGKANAAFRSYMKMFSGQGS